MPSGSSQRCLFTLILATAAIVPCSPLEEAFNSTAFLQHPSCAVGRLLRAHGDFGEAVLALQVCLQHAPTIAVLRFGASARSNLPPLSVCLSVCLPACLSACLSACLPVYLSVCVSVCVSVCLSVCRSVGLSVCPSICLSVCQSVCLSACLSVHLFVCLSGHLSVYRSVCLSVCPSVCLSASAPVRQILFLRCCLALVSNQPSIPRCVALHPEILHRSTWRRAEGSSRARASPSSCSMPIALSSVAARALR